MRESHIGTSDRRLPPMQQASGLPHGDMEPGFDYAAAHPYHTKPPLSSTGSYDRSVTRTEEPRVHRSVPNLDRFSIEHAPPPPPSHSRSLPERPYDGYDADSSDPRRRAQYFDERSQRHPALQQYGPQYASADSPNHPQPYSDHPHAREHHAHISQAQFGSEQQPLYEHRGPRVDDRATEYGRSGLPSPRDYHRSAAHVPPSRQVVGADRGVNLPREVYVPRMPDQARYGSSATSPQDSRRLSEMRSESFGAARSRASSSSHQGVGSATTSRSVTTTRKRKKQFKYMLEQQEADSAKASIAAGAEEDQEGDRVDSLDSSEGPGGASPRKESRKKVKKACIFCKRSHMPCEEARPCKRCVKRGISHLCRDAEPVGSTGPMSAPAPGSSSSALSRAEHGATGAKSKSDEPQDHAHARRRRGDDRDNDIAPATESGSDAESMTSPAASSSRLPDSGFGLTARSNRRPFDVNEIPGASTRDPDFRPTMPISLLLSPAKVELARREGLHADREPSPRVSEREQKEAWNRSMDLSTQHKMQTMLEAGPAAHDLSDIFGEIPTSLLMTPAMANLPKGQSILRPSSADMAGTQQHGEANDRDKRFKRSQSMTLTSNQGQVDEAGYKLPPRPRHLLQEELATTSELRGGSPSYSYTYGYAKLARWMHTRFSRASCEQVDRSLSVIRPKLMALSRSLPEAELIGVEDSFYQLLAFYQANVLEMIPIPMILARRTGEIYAANSHACKLFQLPKSLFEGGQICHYQLVTEEDCVSMWGTYAEEAAGKLDKPPSHCVTLEIDRSLLLFNTPGFDPRTGELLGDGSGLCEDGSPVVVRRKVIVTFEAKLSKHGLPFMVTGVIVPIPDED